MKYELISVDLQNGFTTEGGKHYCPRASVDFDKNSLFPYLKEEGRKISEIISDYRQPRPGDRGGSCITGEWSYESIVPPEIVKTQWVKCMNSPVWTRENIGEPDKTPGLPYPDPEKFKMWLEQAIGKPGESVPVVFGLTIDCCVLSTLQELSWRGYFPTVLKEGVDHYSGLEEDKEAILKTPVSNWAKVITWEELRGGVVNLLQFYI